jgi:chemotaxis protein methyltransferase CheR
MRLKQTTMNYSLTDIEFYKVRKVISAYLGLDFPDDRRNMVRRSLASAARELGFNDMKEFLDWFLTATLTTDQIEILASYLTISETYFWREPQVFTALSQNILPELIALKKDSGKRISIWCAGCSTGEEAYSIAIALYRTVPEINDWKITILATDINSRALSKAREGVYGTWSFRNSPLWLRNRYMNQLNDREWAIDPEIKEMVTFSNFNLIQESYSNSIFDGNKIDIIFCRNVLMYFTNEWAAKVSQNLFNSLTDKGWLIVSSCELSSDLFPQYAPDNFPGAVLYRKGKVKFTDNIIQPVEYKKQGFLSSFFSLVPEIKKPDQPIIKAPENPDPVPQPVLRTYEDILHEKKDRIRLLADNGHLEEALLECNEAIADYKLAPGLYYLKASILQEQDKSHEAVRALKQAIYIDPNYIMGHFTLGNLLFRQGIMKSAKLHFNNALELLNTISTEDIPSESEGLSAKYIKMIILTSLQTQKSG